MLLTTSMHTPELDIKAEESIHWTPEAEERVGRAPAQVRGIARTSILRLALEQGHSVVTSDLVTEAMDRFMPGYTSKQTEKLAEALAFEKARSGQVSICKGCSTVAMVANPVRCTMCGGEEFETVSKETVDEIEAAEGGSEEETTYDGRKLRWTKESREALRVLTDAYQRRRAKARIEKAARRQKMEVVSVELAKRFIEEEGGVLYETASEAPTAPVQEKVAEPVAVAEPTTVGENGKRVIARDPNGGELLSTWDWTPEAIGRVLRVPRGFMRDRTQGRIEDIAVERGASEITLELVEAGIEVGLQMMKEMIAEQGGHLQSSEATGNVNEAPEKEGVCPMASDEGQKAALNEVSVMSELERERQTLRAADA